MLLCGFQDHMLKSRFLPVNELLINTLKVLFCPGEFALQHIFCLSSTLVLRIRLPLLLHLLLACIECTLKLRQLTRP